MLATTGFSICWIAFQIRSLATADPPGLFDAQHDRLDAIVVGRVAKGLDDRGRADRVGRAERIDLALAGHDRANRVDDRRCGRRARRSGLPPPAIMPISLKKPAGPLKSVSTLFFP